MKRTLSIIMCIILTLCILPGCSFDNSGISPNSHRLTKQQMLGDYDAMWRDIDENYSLMGVAERTTKKDFSKVRGEYREKLNGAKSDADFFNVLSGCIGEFEGTGHMCLFNRDTYQEDLSLYKSVNFPQASYLYTVLNNPSSRAFYSIQNDEPRGGISMNLSGLFGGQKNLTTKILEPDRVAYMKIASLPSADRSSDTPEIQKFFKQIKNYGSCIIDIRGNGGGDSRYWVQNIVSPNITKTAEYSNYELVRGETASQYLSSVGFVLNPLWKFKKMPNTNEKDLSQMDWFIDLKDSVSNASSAKAFEGSFYLLTDGGVYSSAEAFAIFCKQTGFATIIGEPTGGDGVGIDPLLFALPNSGAILRFSASLGLNPDGSSNEEFGTVPDYPCAQGKDALQTCLDLIHEGRCS